MVGTGRSSKRDGLVKIVASNVSEASPVEGPVPHPEWSLGPLHRCEGGGEVCCAPYFRRPSFSMIA